MSHTHAAKPYDPMDPHGVQSHDHGHTVVDWRILVGVLAALLFFTVLTVSAANFEKWIAAEFDVVIPTWVNVFVAMSIAVVKATLVLLFFMQLIYDKFLNTVIFLFCLLAFGLFLSLSAIDLGGRGLVNPFTAGQIKPGGEATSAGMATSLAPFVPVVDQPPLTGEIPNMINRARAAEIEKHGLEYWQAHMLDAELQSGHHHPEEPVSSANRSVPRHGLTPGLFDATAPADPDAHGDATHEEQAPAQDGSGH